ncbi:hypothetical protein [Streptomyces chryseus]|uniref:Uncharacterized protein n=1 Tax=Streptomyces chryseus TaxID=68186 RepID=A0ABQ3E8G1_9ACTN|nr:hypothetical protein [Streptomyces chryseus]GHB29756.1 hypothetical protein GCM10010346_61610 [Streptomyces chryseus]
MTFEPLDLNLTDPGKGYLNFVLSVDARLGNTSSSLNADLSIEASQTGTPHFQEWRSRLERCEPNAMHCTLVEPTKIPALFHPCVTEDQDSPAAISGSGCLCRQAFYDPEFGLPVVAEHFRHVAEGGTDQWAYQTYAPLDLRPDDTFSRFISGRSLFWARTEKGLLSILPQTETFEYNIGYSGGGPRALATYLTQVARTDGRSTAAGPAHEKAHPAILAWTQSSAADRGTSELTLSDLKAMLQS